MTTLATLRERVAREVGGYRSFTTTAAGEASGKYLTCTSLDYDDDALKDKWVIITSGVTKVTRKIKNNFYSEGFIYPYVSFGAQIATSVTFEIHDTNPDDYTHFINQAIRDSYPFICQEVRDSTLIGGNVIPNANFEKWTSTSYPDYWTVSVATVAAESTTKLFGSYSMKLSTAAGSCYCSSGSFLPMLSLQDSTVTFKCWVNTAAASTARIGVYTMVNDGSTTATTYSDYHTGSGKWELLEVENVSVPDDLAEIRFICATSTVTAAYFDQVWAIGTVGDYLLPSTIDTVMQVWQCDESAEEIDAIPSERLDFTKVERSGTHYISVPDVSDEKKILLIGTYPYTALTTDASTVDLSTEQESAIVIGAAGLMLSSSAPLISSQDSKTRLQLAQNYLQRFETLKHSSAKGITYHAKRWS